jgi:glyoxylase-like metal-dependent hydrolase (beta-lactamase superfamily II)
MNYEIRVLNLGEIELDSSRLVQNRKPGEKVRVPAHAYLLLGGPSPVLVDTGFRSPAVLRRIGMRAFQRRGQQLESRLAKAGLRPSDIRYVLHTHLHIDHAGQTDKFPMSTTAVINRRELEYAVSGLSGASYPPEDIKHIIDRLHTKGALQLLDLESTGTEEILPGIRCRAAGGHTEGSMVVYVDTAEGVACLCGDVLYDIRAQALTPEGCISREPLLSGNYVVSRRAERAAVKRVLDGARLICPGHDLPAIFENGRMVGRVNDAFPA